MIRTPATWDGCKKASPHPANDAAKSPVGTLFEDTVFHRQFCGEGAFDIPAFIAAVTATGYSGPYGVEVLSDKVRRMPLDAVAETAFRTTAQFLNP